MKYAEQQQAIEKKYATGLVAKCRSLFVGVVKKSGELEPSLAEVCEVSLRKMATDRMVADPALTRERAYYEIRKANGALVNIGNAPEVCELPYTEALEVLASEYPGWLEEHLQRAGAL